MCCTAVKVGVCIISKTIGECLVSGKLILLNHTALIIVVTENEGKGNSSLVKRCKHFTDCSEILTNNIQSAELVADYNHLREITVVVEGLAYNQAINDPRWDAASDDKERLKLVYNYRAKLLSNAKASPEEKEMRKATIDSTDAKANRLLEFSEAAMQHYFEQHDKLVAEVLYPFLSHEKIQFTENGRTIERFMTKEDIIRKIAQPEIIAYNKEAEAKGLPDRKTLRKTIVLAKGMNFDTAEKISEKMNEFSKRRIDSQPLNYPSAGSVFRSLNGVPVWSLIDKSGLRGFSVGGAQVSEKHPLQCHH